MKTFIDLFCGIGGFRVALERKGLECVFSSDIDPAAQVSYLKNFGEMPHGDIVKIPVAQIPPHDVLCAGFPCQSFSVAGNQMGLHEDRGVLFYEILRIAEFHRPKVLLLENVRNILSIDNGKVFRTIRQEIMRLGYDFHAFSLNASHFGLPQKRERIYFVCTRGLRVKFWQPQPTFKKVYFEDIVEKDSDTRIIERDDIVMFKEDNKYQLSPKQIGYFGKNRQGEKIYSVKGHSVCLLATGGCGLFYVDGKVRRASILECKRLMGFPDDHYVGKGSEGFKQLGNAVSPHMVEIVYDNIKQT